MLTEAAPGLLCCRTVSVQTASVGAAGRGRPPQAAARRAGLEFVEKLLTTKLISADTTERDAGMLLPHPRPRTVAWLVMRSTVDSHPHDDTV